MPVSYRNPGRVEFTAEIRVQALPVLDLLSVVVYAPSRSLDDESKEEK